MSTDVKQMSVSELMSELDRIAFDTEPEFCRSKNWRPASVEARKVFEELITPENRAALKQWYAQFRGVDLNPNAETLKACLESATGEDLD